MAFEPGDMQFINNYHVLHGRTAYQDRPGKVRHLKRLWLETDAYPTAPVVLREQRQHGLEREARDQPAGRAPELGGSGQPR